jgi:hypothetical protein
MLYFQHVKLSLNAKFEVSTTICGEVIARRHKRWLPVHEYVANLGEDTCAAFPFWYAFTGCDTVSSFCGRGKKICWNAWKAYSDVTDTFKR